MKSVMHYAVYDIASNAARESIIQILKDAALIRVQKSVFCGMLSNQQKKDLVERIKPVITDEDSFYLLMSCNQCFSNVIMLGKGFDPEYASGKTPSVVL